MADLDPFAAANFAPLPGAAVAPTTVDPFAAAGFAPAPTSVAPKPETHNVIGVDMSGMPVWENPEDQKMQADTNLRGLEKVGEGASLGLFPYASAAARMLAGTPFSQGLKEARDYTAQTSKDQPLFSAIGEGVGGIIPTVATFGAAGPVAAAARAAVPGIPYVAPLARAILSAPAARIAAATGLGAANSAGHDIGSGQTDTLAADTARGAGIGGLMQGAGEVAGPLLQAVPNAAQSLMAGGRNIFTNAGQQGVVGQVLREAGGDFPNQAATSPIPGLALRVPQATGNPGLASLESTLASEPGMQRGDLGDFVTNNRTPNQVSALAHAMVGSDAGIEPSVLTNQASARGTEAIQNLDEGLRGVQRNLWQDPAMQGIRLNSPAIAAGVQQDVAQLPASWRNAVTGPQNRLGAYMDELNELGPNASINDINSVISRLRAAGRAAGSGPQPDAVTAAAANHMANSVLDRIGADPAMIGSPAASNAYQTARTFTREFNGAKGFNEFNNILHPNSQGNMQGNPERQFGQFFDTSGGTDAGLQRLQGLSTFARQAGLGQHADELEGAARQYLGAAVMKQARAGNGLNAIGQPQTNLATLASTANKIAPALNATPMTAPMVGDVQAAGNAAELLNRPSIMRGGTNSTTYERLKQNDLVNAILGQSATSGLGALAGGYAGYRYAPEGVPAYVSVPGGAMAGAMLGSRAGPAVGSMISHTPVLRSIGAGTSEGIRRQVLEALSNMPAYNQAVATPMLTGPALSQPGMLTDAARRAAELSVVPATGRSAR